MIYPNNILTLPLLLLIGTLDLYVFMVGLRLVLGRLTATRNSRLCLALSELTDPVGLAIDRCLSRRMRRQIPPWAAWLVFLCAALIVRHCLVRLIVLLA